MAEFLSPNELTSALDDLARNHHEAVAVYDRAIPRLQDVLLRDHTYYNRDVVLLDDLRRFRDGHAEMAGELAAEIEAGGRPLATPAGKMSLVAWAASLHGYVGTGAILSDLHTLEEKVLDRYRRFLERELPAEVRSIAEEHAQWEEDLRAFLEQRLQEFGNPS